MVRYVFFLFITGLIASGCSSEKVEAPAPQPKVDEVRAKAAEGGQQPSVGQESRSAVAGVGILPGISSKNKLPEIVTIKLSPRLVYPGAKVKAEPEAKDEDGDTVSYYYEWKRNDEVLTGEILDEIDTAGFKKGDFITVTVTPYDGKEKGKPRRSLPLIVANRPPEITSSPPSELSNGKYIYEVKATDPDGDNLTYSLEGGPPGMAIDPATGVIRWDGPQRADIKPDSGYNIKIVVTDGDAKAFQGFELSLTK